jgi:glycosyltransferase involved in cell wall biosynthesis
MHILEIPSFFTPYGGEFCLEQARALHEQGHEVCILSNVQISLKRSVKNYLFTPYARWTEVMDDIPVYRSFQHGVPKLIKYNVYRWVSIVRSMFRDYVKRHGKPDILHAHCCKWAGYAAMLISDDYNIPYVITEHLSKKLFEDEFGPAPSTAWQIPLLRKAYNNANLVITVSDELVEDIACYFGNDYRHTTVSNIIDTDFFAFKQREIFTERPFRFCCLANYTYLKGYDILVEAMNKLHDKVIELHVAGRDTDDEQLQAMIENMSLGNRIFIHGELDKAGVRNLLYQCDAFVLASRSEVQPLSILEAMSTGMPYIATEVTPRNLRHPDCGMIVPVDDADSLSKAMLLMSERSSSTNQKMISKVARDIASPEKVGKQLSDLFADIVLEYHKKTS